MLVAACSHLSANLLTLAVVRCHMEPRASLATYPICQAQERHWVVRPPVSVVLRDRLPEIRHHNKGAEDRLVAIPDRARPMA